MWFWTCISASSSQHPLLSCTYCLRVHSACLNLIVCFEAQQQCIGFADSDQPCTLTLEDAKIGNNIQRAGLYLLHNKAPFVKPLMSVAVNAHTRKVVLPVTGRQLGDAVRDSCLVNLGLCIQHVSELPAN